jgi:hypothetical protein
MSGDSPRQAEGSRPAKDPIDGDEVTRWLAEGQARARTSWTANDF